MKTSMLLLLMSAMCSLPACTRKITVSQGNMTVSPKRDARETITYRDDKVLVGTQPPPFFPFNVHGSENRFLIINGKRYDHVRGTERCYLGVPQLDSVLFVTQHGLEKIVFHLVSLKTRKEIQIPAHGSVFGHSIGSGPQSGTSDWIERLMGHSLVLGSTRMGLKQFHYLNLEKRTLEKVEELYLDKSGAVTNRAVFEGESLK